MNMKQSIFIFVFLLVSVQALRAQEPIALDEVEVSDTQLKRFSNTQQTAVLTDSILAKNDASLTSLLNNNSSIYFKENGLGMVSSPSFRGTTAQQTAVLWNGININSQLNGQTDFNTINTRNFDAIEVRSGGGSVLFGSGAMGGTVHLSNRISFNKGLQSNILAKYGSFNTIDANYKGTYSTEKLSLNLGVSRLSSDNDYDYVNGSGKNINGQYENNTLSFYAGYKISDKNLLKLYSYVYDGDRHFSLIVPSETRTKYHDFNTRNLLEWDGFYGSFISKLKLAYINEEYKYYQNIKNDSYTNGSANSFIGKYDLAYNISEDIILNGVTDVTVTNGDGSSIPENARTITSFNLMWKHKLTSRFLYEVTGRKEFTSNYKSPFLFSAGGKYKVTKSYTLKANASRNFRIPTYNDLYWQGSGNPDLKPETSWQGELINDFSYKSMNVSVTGFYNDITDMIVWVPTSSNWMPVNTRHVETYGIEALWSAKKMINKHVLQFSASYAYTVSKDTDTGYQLMYVPYHKGSGTIQYTYKNISVYYQYLYVGEVFTRTDNNSLYNLDAYSVSNISAEYAFGKQKQLTAGAQVKNLLNEDYQSVANRFMPGINYTIYLNFNF